MSEPIIAQRKPCFVELEAGRRYAWCRCGRSSNQPWCDGAHRGTGIEPLRFAAEASAEAVLCGCKRTGDAPYCDGTHNNLAETYEQAGEEEIRASAAIPVTPREHGVHGKAALDGGCYVVTVAPPDGPGAEPLQLRPVIDRRDGARFLTQYRGHLAGRRSAVLSFPDAEVVLFTVGGEGRVCISGRWFDLPLHSGAYLRPGEALALERESEVPLDLLLSLSPQCAGPRSLETMPAGFDETLPDRVTLCDPQQREAMADRFYQVLIDDRAGSREMTQFVGEIPRSRAKAHRHLYEEAIAILSGEGYMWTENARAAVRPGDVIFLPRKQIHSLECTSEAGMRLVGVFCPAGSPAVNY